MAVVALMLAACGVEESTDPGDVGAGTSTTIPPDAGRDTDSGDNGVPDDRAFELPTDPEAVLLEWRSVGGFAPVEHNVGRAPRAVLTVGGDLYFEAPSILIYPGPQLRQFQVARLSDQQMSAILALIENTELVRQAAGANDTANQFVADADTSVFVLHQAEGVTSQYSVYALGYAEAEDADVVAFEALADALQAAMTVAEIAPIVRLQVVAAPSGSVSDIELSSVVPWPFADLDELPEMFLGVRCFEIPAADVDAAIALFDAGTDVTFYESRGETWRVLVRPLLSDEPACAVSS